MGFNRNIIIQDDIKKWLDPNSPNPKTMTANPPALVPVSLVPAAAVPGAVVPGAVVPPGAVPAGAVPPGAVPPGAVPPGAVAAGAAGVGAAAAAGVPVPAGAPAPAAPGGVAVPTEDDYLTKLLKYVPIEVLGAYLFMAGVIDSNVTNKHDHAVWLGSLLIGILVLTIPYDRVVLKVARVTQIAMSVVGLAVYIFALGGWFATTSWYHQWYASILVPAFAFVVAIFKLPPLPTEKAA